MNSDLAIRTLEEHVCSCVDHAKLFHLYQTLGQLQALAGWKLFAPPPPPDRLLTADEAAPMLGISCSTLYREADRYPRGRSPALGRRVRSAGTGPQRGQTRKEGALTASDGCLRLPHASAIHAVSCETGASVSNDLAPVAASPETTSPSRDGAKKGDSHPTPDPRPELAALRQQNHDLSTLLVEQSDALHAVLEYAQECYSRTGTMIDTAEAAARLWPIVARLDIKPRLCPGCVERRMRGAA